MNNFTPEMIIGIFIPFLGTVLGSACVFVLRKEFGTQLSRALTGFAGGVMTAASVWSLLIPSMEQSSHMGKLGFIPAVIGFLLGIFFLLAIDAIVPHLHSHDDCPEGICPRNKTISKQTMMMLAVTIHNLPEGMAVGVVLAGMVSGQMDITIGGALALAIGIAIQNFPEGAILSMPLHASGESKLKAFGSGALSGVVEPLGTILVLLLSRVFTPILPYLLSFAAGAMIYVVVEELIPEMSEGEHSNIGVIVFAIGFALMMVLDVALG